MAVITVFVDGAGNVVSLTNTPPDDIRRKLQESIGRDLGAARTLPLGTAGSPSPDAPVRTQPLMPIQGLGTDAFLIQNVSEGIKDSPILTDDQRAAARAVFNTILPGDTIEFRLAPGAALGQPGIILGGGDAPPRAAPLIAVLIDP